MAPSSRELLFYRGGVVAAFHEGHSSVAATKCKAKTAHWYAQHPVLSPSFTSSSRTDLWCGPHTAFYQWVISFSVALFTGLHGPSRLSSDQTLPLPGPRSVERGGGAAYPINASTMVLRSTRRGCSLVEPNRTRSTHDRHNFLLTRVDELGIHPPCFGHGPVALHIRHSLFHQEATIHPPLTCCTLLSVNSAKSPFAT